MNLRLPRYREVKDKYCVSYFGPCNEYITLLLGLRKQAEKALPGLQLYIGCHEDMCGPERTVPSEVVLQMIREPWGTAFGHIREIRCNLQDHPVEQFFKAGGITLEPTTHQPEPNNRIVRFYPDGVSPTRSCDNSEIQAITKKFSEHGYLVRRDGPWQDAGIVVGVESVPLWESVLSGKSVILFNTGLGASLFRSICPWGEVISDPKDIHISEKEV